MSLYSKILLAISAVLAGILFYFDFKYISAIGFSFARDSLGPFIFLVSAYIIWMNFDKLKSVAIKPNWIGLAGVIFSILIYFAGLRSGLSQMYHVSFILFMLSSIVLLFGFGYLLLLWFPIAYTFFVIPIGFMRETIGVPLRFFVTSVSVGIFDMLGFNVMKKGTSIYLDYFSFDIAAPCSGINSLVSLFALAVVFAYITEKSIIKRIVLSLSAIPIAVFVNILRVVSIGLVAKSLKKDIALSIYHDYSGYFLFIMSLGLLYVEKKILDGIKIKKDVVSE